MAQGAPPACVGRDLYAELRAKDPSMHAAIEQAARAEENTEALLWRVERDGRPPSWLFGTVHLTDPRVHILSPETIAAFDGARVLALEVDDLSATTMARTIGESRHMVMLPGGQSLRSVLSAEELAILQPNGADSAMSQMRPWFVSMLLAMPPCEQVRQAAGLKSLDSALRERAVAKGIKTMGLETIREQLEALASMPREAELAWLKWSIRLYPQVTDLTETIVQLYLNRKLGVVWPLSQRGLAGEVFPAEAMARFRSALIDERNVRMRDRALPQIQRGNAFIAVGALHLPGTTGLVRLLRDAGWRVTAVK
jgi:hypothetical protein